MPVKIAIHSPNGLIGQCLAILVELLPSNEQRDELRFRYRRAQGFQHALCAREDFFAYSVGRNHAQSERRPDSACHGCHRQEKRSWSSCWAETMVFMLFGIGAVENRNPRAGIFDPALGTYLRI